MTILAGTSEGVYAVDAQGTRRVLESRCVRDLVRSDGRIFAGTDTGLFITDDSGDNWSTAGLDDREVWQIRGGRDGTLYAATQPAGLFQSTDFAPAGAKSLRSANTPRRRTGVCRLHPAAKRARVP